MAKKRKREPVREERITTHILVDCYDRDERAMGWYYYLEDRLRFPFTAACILPIAGQRIKRTRLIQTEKYVVAVDVEMVVPVDDPGEPCYESETIQLLREIKELAERGDVSWLTQKGKVYTAVEAA